MILISVAPILLSRYVFLIADNMMLSKEATLDALTGLYAYRYLSLSLHKQFEKMQPPSGSLSVIFFDLDHFKNINDTYGHEFGNIVLKAIAATLKKNTRSEDLVARYGGEEFCLLMRNVPIDTVLACAERIRENVKQLKFNQPGVDEIHVTISGGISSTTSSSFETGDALLKAADSALYTSKNSGRDKITIYS